MLSDVLRRIFRLFNRYFMVPMFRLGMGPFIGNPLTGYIMVLKTRGRKSGRIRFSPVNYAIHNGSVYCLAGWGKTTDWYRNLSATPQVELILPAGAYSGTAETVADPAEKRIIIRQVLKNGGFAGFFEGYNPYTISDEQLTVKTEEAVLVRIRPNGLGSAAADPGGWLWIIVWGAMLAWLLQRLARKNR
jgi:deazaflavin-dependent oxidoreductase (nitroreductase family)